MKNKRRIVFATNNAHKLSEARQILSDSYEIISLEEIGCHEEIPETADTLEGNARIKAEYIYSHYGCDCFADDTGLMVEALNGRPGVYSARYAGEHCSPADNVAKLLNEMKGIEDRSAHFSTVIALVQDGNFHTFEGKVEGLISENMRGNGGFGYDPIFIEKQSGKSFAEMSPEEKNEVSHRGRALNKLRNFLGMLMILLITGLGIAIPSQANNFQMLPSYDGQMENIIITPKLVYFLGTAQSYRKGSSVNGSLYGTLFRYDIENNEMNSINKNSGLSGNIITAIAYNYSSRYLAIAFDNGLINLLHDDGKIDLIPGLSISNPSLDKTINDLTIDEPNHKIYVATNFGFVVIDDTINEISNSKILDVSVSTCTYYNNKMWIGTKDGLYYGSPDSYSFADYTKIEGPIVVNNLFAFQNQALYVYYGDPWSLCFGIIENSEDSPFFKRLNKDMLNGASFSKDFLVATTSKEVLVVDSHSEIHNLTMPTGFEKATAATLNNKSFWFSDGRDGIACLEAPNEPSGKWTMKIDRHLPNASTAFLCSSMAIHPEYGVLIRNHGYEHPFTEMMTSAYDLICGFKSGFWTPLSTTYKVKDGLMIDNPWGIAIDPQNSNHIYCGTERSGLFRLDIKNPEKSMQFSKATDLYGNQTKTGYVAVLPDNPAQTWAEQCVFANPCFDNSSNLWSIYVDPVPNMSDEGVSDKLIFVVWEPDARKNTTSASAFTPWKTITIENEIIGNTPKVLALKSSNAKNIVIGFGNAKTSDLVVLDHAGTIDNTSDDRVLKLNTIYDQDGEALKIGAIYHMYEDPTDGQVWVGCNFGVFTFDPIEIFNSNGSVRRIKVPRNDGTNLADYLLNNVKVNFITADVNNRKWFGTQGAGLICTSPDGKTIYANYTTENSDIPGNYVYSMIYNPENGTILISTDKGLAQLAVSSNANNSSAEAIRCYPNPVRPEYFGTVSIDGLSDDAMVKILDTAGNLIKECGQASGGFIEWNITNSFSKRVPGGVYYVYATQGNNSESYSKVGKILVIE